MKSTVSKLHKNRIFSLIIWLAIIFIAIIYTPSLNNMIQQAGDITYSSNAQPKQAAKIQAQMGHGLGHTKQVSLVYNHGHKPITKKQQAKINAKLTTLKKDQDYYGIKRITSLKTNKAGKAQILSKDKTTEVITLDLKQANADLPSITTQLVSASKISGLKNYVTSPTIINQLQTKKIAKITNIVTIALFVVAALIVLIYFRSILAAFVSLIVLFASYVVSLSIVTNLAIHYHWAFSVYSQLEIAIATLTMGLIWNIYLYRHLKRTLLLQPDGAYATQQMIKGLRFPITAVGFTLAIGFGLTGFLPFIPIKALYGVGIAYLVLMLAVLTINPIFTAALGESLFWPNNRPNKHVQSHFWSKVVSFSLWRPLAGLLVAVYLTFPFIYNFRPSLDFTPVAAIKDHNQAVNGAKVLQAHFNEGKPTPVTIYLKNDWPFNQEAYLQQIDQLTTKLQTMTGVHDVYSVTQPSGMPIDKYYVSNQLTDITSSVKSAAKQLDKIKKELKGSQKNLDVEKLQQQVAKLDELTTTNQTISDKSGQIKNQVTAAASQASASQQSSANKKVRTYESKLAALKTKLNLTSTDVADLVASVNAAQSGLSGSYTSLDAYSTKIQKVKDDLDDVQIKSQAVKKQLDSVYNYLHGLQKSSAADVYYITSDQLQDTDFLQNMYNYNSKNNKITTLQVVFNKAPGNQTSAQMTQLQDQIKTQTQGSTLRYVKVALAGEPVAVAAAQNGLKHDLIIAMAIILTVILIAVFSLSRAMLQPLYWTIAFVISLITGFQLTYLSLGYFNHTNSFDWHVLPLVLVAVTAVGAWQIISLGLSMRYTRLSLLEWIRPTMASYAQVVRYIMLVMLVIVASVALTAWAQGMAMTMIELALITGFTFIIYYLILPMIVSSLGKMAVKASDKSRLLKKFTK